MLDYQGVLGGGEWRHNYICMTVWVMERPRQTVVMETWKIMSEWGEMLVLSVLTLYSSQGHTD